MRITKLWWTAVLAALASLGLAAAGLSVAAAGDGPSTAAVSATFTGDRSAFAD